MKAEIELTKYGEVVVLDFEYTYTRATHACERDTLDILPLTLQNFCEDTGEPLPLVDAGNLVITDYIQEQLTGALKEYYR